MLGLHIDVNKQFAEIHKVSDLFIQNLDGKQLPVLDITSAPPLEPLPCFRQQWISSQE